MHVILRWCKNELWFSESYANRRKELPWYNGLVASSTEDWKALNLWARNLRFTYITTSSLYFDESSATCTSSSALDVGAIDDWKAHWAAFSWRCYYHLFLFTCDWWASHWFTFFNTCRTARSWFDNWSLSIWALDLFASFSGIARRIYTPVSSEILLLLHVQISIQNSTNEQVNKNDFMSNTIISNLIHKSQ